MINTQLDTTLEHYQTAIERLKGADSIELEQVLMVLNTRDEVQKLLKEQKSISNSRLKKLIDLDTELRKNALLITKAVNGKTPEQLAHWRESVQPSPESWWWKLESIAPHPWDAWDWLWKCLTIIGWTANLSLLVSIGTRFLSAGVGLGGASAVILPSIIALLQASSEVTKSGQEGFEKLLDKLNIPKQFQQEAKLASTFMMSILLVSFWLALPAISDIYNRNGLRNRRQGNLGMAEQDYLQAISLNSDNAEAHFNLGNLYEEWQDWEKAIKEYKIAVAADLPEAYNNLSRLYIRDKKYLQAAVLLAKGLVLANKKNINPEVRYSLFKNLGWASLTQGRYEEAQQSLQAAIGIANNPKMTKYISNPGSAHCLLAQVLDKQKKSISLQEWQKCSELGSRLNIDEYMWLHLANEKLKKRE
jgi:tetratricopeptide (TPR) repeat protein